MPEPIRFDSLAVDLNNRFQHTETVGASPSAATETIIGTLTLANFAAINIVKGIALQGWAAFTVGTSGTAVNLRIRQTNVSGTVIAASGATTAGIAAGNLATLDVQGFDAGAGVGVYVLTMQVTGGAATSTVSALQLVAELL